MQNWGARWNYLTLYGGIIHTQFVKMKINMINYIVEWVILNHQSIPYHTWNKLNCRGIGNSFPTYYGNLWDITKHNNPGSRTPYFITHNQGVCIHIYTYTVYLFWGQALADHQRVCQCRVAGIPKWQWGKTMGPKFVMWSKQCHKPSPISPRRDGMLTIPSHGWFMALF